MLVENFNQMRASLANKTSENAELSVKLVTLENQLEIETKTKEEVCGYSSFCFTHLR